MAGGWHFFGSPAKVLLGHIADFLKVPSTWLGQSIRFTFFPHEQWNAAAFDGIWSTFVADSPAVDESKPREQARRIAGDYKDGVGLEIQITPARLDLFFVPSQSAAPPLPDDFGPFEPLLQEVSTKVDQWLAAFPFDLGRAALGVVLIDPAESRLASYAKLMKYAKSLKLDLKENVSDLIFQINHTMQSKAVEGVTINRLMKFMAVLKTGVMFTIASGGQPFALPGNVPRTFTTIELDISTNPGKILERASLRAIFEELGGIAHELAAQGEP